MTVPDKLPYEKNEKLLEAVCGAVFGFMKVVEILLMALGYLSGAALITFVVSLVVYGAFSLCSVYPQHTNLFTKPEECTEEKFRRARKSMAFARMIIVSALFLLTIITRI